MGKSLGKTNEFFVLKWSFENLIFSNWRSKEVGFIMLLLSKSQIINASLWLICSKTFELIVYTFIFAF